MAVRRDYAAGELRDERQVHTVAVQRIRRRNLIALLFASQLVRLVTDETQGAEEAAELDTQLEMALSRK